MKSLLLTALLFAAPLFAADGQIKDAPVSLQVPGQSIGMTLSLEHNDQLQVDIATFRALDNPEKGIMFAGAAKDGAYKGAQLKFENGKPVFAKDVVLGLGLSAEKRAELFRMAEKLFTDMQSMAHIRLLYSERANFLGIMLLQQKVVLVTKRF